MTGPKVVPEHDAVTSVIEIAAPPERVFAALTDAKQLFAWWVGSPRSNSRSSRWTGDRAGAGASAVSR